MYHFTKLFVILAVFSVVAVFAQESASESETTTRKEIVEQIPVKNSTQVEGTSSGDTCSCGTQESPVCASNGVTYKNSCRFDCTKKRVKRLRIVKNGRCNGLSLNQYRGSQNRRS